jgi:hypothetical protein
MTAGRAATAGDAGVSEEKGEGEAVSDLGDGAPRSIEARIEVFIARQELLLWQGERLLRRYLVSTARNGPGEEQGSECTPRGRHEIAARIGADAPLNAVFVARVPTGEIYSPALRREFPERDWILTRILWLAGLEPGKNAGGSCDSRARYIYLHGTPDDVTLGRPGSRGCVRIRNRDVVELFDLVSEGTPVEIHE